MRKILAFIGCCIMTVLTTCQAETYYVSTNGLDIRDGLNYWTNAVATLSNAAAKANKIAGSEILVSNGTYYLTNQVTLSNGVTCRGFSGDPKDVIVDGSATTRCFYMDNAAVLASVTVTNGNPLASINNGDGGGIYAKGGATISNCIVTGNSSKRQGGGICAGDGQILHSVIHGNFAAVEGGGIRLYGHVTVSNCTIVQNTTSNTAGGGLHESSNSTNTIVNCHFISNAVTINTLGIGGGVCSSAKSIYRNCVFAYNSVTGGNGGGVYLWAAASSNLFVNCLIYSNQALYGGGAYARTGKSYWYNCTFSRNRAITASGGGGVYLRSDPSSVFMINCILHNNTAATSSSNYYILAGTAFFSNSCAMPDLSPTYGDDNIPEDPQFKAPDDYNFRLLATSPCINAALMQDFMLGTLDLDGRSRIDRFSGKMDMGAYEYIPRGALFTGR